jgi:hypothetical protein
MRREAAAQEVLRREDAVLLVVDRGNRCTPMAQAVKMEVKDVMIETGLDMLNNPSLS